MAYAVTKLVVSLTGCLANIALKAEPSSVSQATGIAESFSARDVWIKNFTTISAPVFKSIASPRGAWIKAISRYYKLVS